MAKRMHEPVGPSEDGNRVDQILNLGVVQADRTQGVQVAVIRLRRRRGQGLGKCQNRRIPRAQGIAFSGVQRRGDRGPRKLGMLARHAHWRNIGSH